jgi:hypothetical protein
MKIAIVKPNVSDEFSYHVHSPECRSLEKYSHQPVRIDVDSRVQASDSVYSPTEFDCLSGDYLHELKFFPCVGLPQAINDHQTD